MTPTASQARVNYHEECEAAINRHINTELRCSYTLMSMAAYFDRDDIALKGFSDYFRKRSDEEREDADKLIKYQNMRGGRIVLADVMKPQRDSWGSGVEAMTAALDMQKSVNLSLLEVHAIASNHRDPQMTDFLEEFLESQAKLLREIAHHVTNLKRVGPGLGEYQFDRTTLAS